MTTIVFDVRVSTDSGDAKPLGPHEAVFHPRRVYKGSYLRTNRPMVVTVLDGVGAALGVDPSPAGTAYKVEEQWPGGVTRWVVVPDVPTVGYHELPDVDPRTLEAKAAPVSAWWAVADDLQDRVVELEVNGGGGPPPDLSLYATLTELDVVAQTIPTAISSAVAPLATTARVDLLEQSIPDVTGLVSQAALQAVAQSIPSISGLATTSRVDAVEASIPSLAGYATEGQVSAASTADRQRSNHVGSQAASTISDFATAVDARIGTQKGTPNGLATLGANGKLSPTQVPAVAIVDVYSVSSQAEMLALGAQGAERGDIAIRDDVERSYILVTEPASTLANWKILKTPTAAVWSVNGEVGAIAGLAWQSDVDIHVNDTNNPHQVTKVQVGLGDVDNTADMAKPISTAVAQALAGKQATIAAGTSTQYRRGDNTWAELNHDAIADGTTYKRFTATEKTKLGNISGTNTGDQNLASYVQGAIAATDNAVARWDTATGKLLQNSLVTIDDNGAILAGSLNTPNGATGAALGVVGGRAARGIVIQQALAAGSFHALEIQRSDGGNTAWFDGAGSLRFQGTTDAGIYNTSNGAAIGGSNAKNQLQASNAASQALGIYGFTSQTADLQRWLTAAGAVMTAIDAAGKLVFGSNGFQDTNLYRSAANVLATDDAFSAAGPVTGSNLSGTNTGDETLARVLALLGLSINSIVGSVNHGTNANAARPSGYALVIWTGSVQPLNMTGVDVWNAPA